MIKTRQWFDANVLLYYTLMVVVLSSYAVPLYLIIAYTFINKSEANGIAWLLNIPGLLLIALTLKPVWNWAKPRVYHVVYTMDESQAELIGHLSDSFVSVSPEPVMLSAIAETIAHTMKLPHVQIETPTGVTGAYGTRIKAAIQTRLEINYGEALVGWLEVSSRLPNEPLTTSEHLLLNNLARQIGITLHVTQLTAVLQTSREQIIIAREAERRRIRNDLHDGLAPSLSAFQLQLGAIRRLLTQNPAQAEPIITELSADLRQATAVIRQLVYDLRPPLLDELGLIEAIKNRRLTDTSLQLNVIAPDPMPVLSAATEVAVYRIVTEAIHNVVKHAQATTCTITLTFEAAHLILTIADDGQGIAANQLRGIGIQSMRDRAAELGGTFVIQPAESAGTCIEVRLPWRNEDG